MADLPDVVTVFVIAGVVGFRIINIHLQIRFQFGVVEVRVANILLIRQIGGREVGGLKAGEHSRTSGKPRREQHYDQRQQSDKSQCRLMRRRRLRHSTDDLAAGS